MKLGTKGGLKRGTPKMRYTLTYNGVKSKWNESFPLKLSVINFKASALLLGYLDPKDKISLEKLIGKGEGANHPPFSF